MPETKDWIKTKTKNLPSLKQTCKLLKSKVTILINIYNYSLQVCFVFYAFAVPFLANGFPKIGNENSYSIAYFIFDGVFL